jgi:hypothetical protein
MKPASLLLVTCLAAACGGDDDNDDGGSGDATVFAVATDYTTSGVASTISLPSLEVTQNAIAGVASTDPLVRQLDQLYVVNRVAGNVTIVDKTSMTLIDQVGTGPGSNPQDVAVTEDRMYVVGLGLGAVLVFDRADLEAGPVDELDLSSLDEDGKPDCHSIAVAGDQLFVSCGRFDDSFTPRGVGLVAVLDLGSGDLVDTLELPHANPIGFLRSTPGGGPLGGDLLVATAPSYADLTQGCVARISIGAAPAASCWIDNAELGGYAGGIAPTLTDGVWLAAVSGFDPADFGALGALRRHDGAALAAALSGAAERIFDVVACPTGHVVVADAAGGVRVYDGDRELELSTAVLDLGLPPVQNGLACY